MRRDEFEEEGGDEELESKRQLVTSDLSLKLLSQTNVPVGNVESGETTSLYAMN